MSKPNDDRSLWTKEFRLIERSSLEQSWAYGDAVTAHFKIDVRRRRLTLADGTAGWVQIFDKKIGGAATVSQIVRGPLWLTQTAEPSALIEPYRRLRQEHRWRDRRFLLWSPELPAAPDSIGLMRRAGLRQMATGYSTIWIDLRKSGDQLLSELRGKWRNTLRLSERSPLDVCLSVDAPHRQSFLDGYDRHFRSARYMGPSRSFVQALIVELARDNGLTLLSASSARVPVAGALFARHGSSATYYASWTTPAGRRLHAHNRLIWQAIRELQARGVEWLDLGGVNAISAPGVARFKLGIGGTLHTLAGTFL